MIIVSSSPDLPLSTDTTIINFGGGFPPQQDVPPSSPPFTTTLHPPSPVGQAPLALAQLSPALIGYGGALPPMLTEILAAPLHTLAALPSFSTTVTPPTGGHSTLSALPATTPSLSPFNMVFPAISPAIMGTAPMVHLSGTMPYYAAPVSGMIPSLLSPPAVGHGSYLNPNLGSTLIPLSHNPITANNYACHNSGVGTTNNGTCSVGPPSTVLWLPMRLALLSLG